MGGFEFGIYIYAWTWVLLIGGMVDLGLGSAAQRFIPEYTEHKQFALLRGFLGGSRWLALRHRHRRRGASAPSPSGMLAPHLDPETIIPLYLSCAALPMFGARPGAERHCALLQLGQSRTDRRSTCCAKSCCWR